jgi:hypothetical protein
MHKSVNFPLHPSPKEVIPVKVIPKDSPILNPPGNNVVQSPQSVRLGMQINYHKCLLKETANMIPEK